MVLHMIIVDQSSLSLRCPPTWLPPSLHWRAIGVGVVPVVWLRLNPFDDEVLAWVDIEGAQLTARWVWMVRDEYKHGYIITHHLN